MYAYTSFPSRFAVFRGPYHSTLRTELINSIMIFDSTPSADDSFYTATMRPWVGTIVGHDDMPDTAVRTVKIHSPLRANHHGNAFSPSNERFVVLPFTLEVNATSWVHSAIPILAFESSNWMPRFDEQLIELQLLHRIQGEMFKHHYQNINYVASALMRTTAPLPSYITWLQSLPDPYTLMNRSEIIAIPYIGLSPTNIHTLRRNIIIDYHRRNMAAGTVIDAAVAAVQPPAVDYDDYSSMFDAAAGYVAPAETPLLQEEPPTISAFILMNHLAHEVQKGTECPITFEPLISLAKVAMSPECGHFFDPEALKAWGRTQLSAGAPIICPVCRTQLRNVIEMTNNSYKPPVVS